MSTPTFDDLIIANARQAARAVCRRWREASFDEAFSAAIDVYRTLINAPRFKRTIGGPRLELHPVHNVPMIVQEPERTAIVLPADFFKRTGKYVVHNTMDRLRRDQGMRRGYRDGKRVWIRDRSIEELLDRR